MGVKGTTPTPPPPTKMDRGSRAVAIIIRKEVGWNEYDWNRGGE